MDKIKNTHLLPVTNLKNWSDYHQEIYARQFETWFERQLIPNIPSNRVTVLNNVSYYTRTIEKIQVREKTDYIFLWNQHIGVSTSSMYKKTLLDIVKENIFEKFFFIDELVTSKSHHIHDYRHIIPYLIPVICCGVC